MNPPHACNMTATATVMARRLAGSSLPVTPTYVPRIVSQLGVLAPVVPNYRANHTGPRPAARGARLKWRSLMRQLFRIFRGCF